MNIYILLEGEKASRKLYRNWIPLVNSKLQYADYINQIDEDKFYILAGLGQPLIYERITHAVTDVNTNTRFTRLVIALDSEGENPRDKQIAVSRFVDKIGCNVEVRYVIQHACLETWLLANRNMFRKNTRNPNLISFRDIFDILKEDPEHLPHHTTKSWNVAQFAYEYLRAGISDVVGNKSKFYSKKNPGVTVERGYFDQVKLRLDKEHHIQSFRDFLNAFI